MDKALVHNSDWQERTAEHWEPKKAGFTNRFPGDKQPASLELRHDAANARQQHKH